MTDQDWTQPDITGAPPPLAGLICEGLVLEAFLHHGEVVSPASSLFIKAGGHWHCLTLDAGVIHWRPKHESPQPWAAPEHAWEYPHTNIAARTGLLGLRILGYAMSADESGCAVAFTFEQGRQLVLQERQGVDHYTVI